MTGATPDAPVTAKTPDEEIVDAAVTIHNLVHDLGLALPRLLQALDVKRRAAYREGGTPAVEDFLVHAGRDRVLADLAGMFVAAGLGDLLAHASRQAHPRPLPGFAPRYVALVQSGRLETHRGRPNAFRPPPPFAKPIPQPAQHSLARDQGERPV